MVGIFQILKVKHRLGRYSGRQKNPLQDAQQFRQAPDAVSTEYRGIMPLRKEYFALTRTEFAHGVWLETRGASQTDPTFFLREVINRGKRHADLRRHAELQRVVYFSDHLDATLKIVPGESIGVVLQIVGDRDVRLECYLVLSPGETSRESWLDKAAADFIEIIIVFQRSGVIRTNVVLHLNEKFLS